MAKIGDINVIFLCNVQNGLAGSKLIDVTIDGNAVLIHGEPFLKFLLSRHPLFQAKNNLFGCTTVP
jgi:hypothetical protein